MKNKDGVEVPMEREGVWSRVVKGPVMRCDWFLNATLFAQRGQVEWLEVASAEHCDAIGADAVEFDLVVRPPLVSPFPRGWGRPR
jgi:hypothetical protein